MSFLSNNRSVQHLVTYRPLLKELVVRDLKVKYRRSVLGYLWSLLNPLLMMVVMTVVFSYFFRYQIENYPLYLISGQILWTFFNESTNMAMFSVIDNAALIKKVYIPKFIFPLSRVFSSFVTMGFSLVAILIVMIFTRATFSWTILLFPIPLFMLLIFSCGMGLILSSMSVYFRDITHLYSVVTMAWMYLTPIFYPIETLPEDVAVILQFNPMYHYLFFFRQLILYGTIPTASTWMICGGVSIGMLAIGMLVFKKLQKNFILYI